MQTEAHVPCCVGRRNVASANFVYMQTRSTQWCVNIAIGECTVFILTNVTVTVHTNHAIKVP